jgi:hypothetical protein
MTQNDPHKTDWEHAVRAILGLITIGLYLFAIIFMLTHWPIL